MRRVYNIKIEGIKSLKVIVDTDKNTIRAIGSKVSRSIIGTQVLLKKTYYNFTFEIVSAMYPAYYQSENRLSIYVGGRSENYAFDFEEEIWGRRDVKFIIKMLDRIFKIKLNKQIQIL